ncbi:MAG: FKBP-type peptidyl-prolyl cis-trans isomerase, partial [Candidatus Latescibacteria bacterium]|nr:FKBP-type peptidyl-prolyl cis-trans isomerase [Candidatus Latescibacterota bacterium]
AQQVIPGFEQGVLGMNPSDTKTIYIPCNEAYGPHSRDMVAVIPRDQLPLDMSPEIGQQLSLQLEDDRTLLVRVANINDEQVTLDANHPLAGEALTFDIELMEIV